MPEITEGTISLPIQFSLLDHVFNKAVSAVNTKLKDYIAPKEIHVHSIIVQGTANNRVDIELNGRLWNVARYLANTSATFEPAGSHSFILKLKRGDRLKFTSNLATTGNHDILIYGW